MKKILVTGGAGYIGSHAVKRLLLDGHMVIVFDNLSHGYREVIEILKPHGNLEFVKGDLGNKSDLEKVFTVYKEIDAVFHFAGLCSVDESMKMPELYFQNNIDGTRNLLEAMKRHNVRRIIFSSTCAVYGEAQYLPVDEAHPCNPTNPYGESKRKAEETIREFAQLSDFKFAILRYFNVCGADSDGEIGDSKKPSLLLVQNAVRGALGLEPFSLTYESVPTKDGSPVRDYIDVEDLVEAHIKAYEYLGTGGENVTLNLGVGKGISVLEIVKAVEHELNVKIPKAIGNTRAGEYAEIYAAPEKAQETLQWLPKKTLDQSIQTLALWYRTHPTGYSF